MPTVVISNADIQSAAVNNKSSVSLTDKLTSSSSTTTTTTSTTTSAPRETLATINAKLVSVESVSAGTVDTDASTTSTLTPNVASERMMLTQSTVKTDANSNFKGSSGSSSRSSSENNNNNGSHSEGFLTPNTHHHNNISRQRISAVKVTLPPGGVKGASAAKNSKINAPPGLNYVFDAHPNINKHHHHDYR